MKSTLDCKIIFKKVEHFLFRRDDLNDLQFLNIIISDTLTYLLLETIVSITFHCVSYRILMMVPYEWSVKCQMFNVFFIYVDGCWTIWIKRRYSVNVKTYKKTTELWLVDLCLTPLSIIMCYLINGMFVLVDKAWMPRENHRSSVWTLTILLSYDLKWTHILNIVRDSCLSIMSSSLK